MSESQSGGYSLGSRTERPHAESGWHVERDSSQPQSTRPDRGTRGVSRVRGTRKESK